MLCPGCKYPHSEVVYTIQDANKNMTNRRRQCLRCGLRFTTAEQLKPPRKQRNTQDSKDRIADDESSAM